MYSFGGRVKACGLLFVAGMLVCGVLLRAVSKSLGAFINLTNAHAHQHTAGLILCRRAKVVQWLGPTVGEGLSLSTPTVDMPWAKGYFGKALISRLSNHTKGSRERWTMWELVRRWLIGENSILASFPSWRTWPWYRCVYRNRLCFSNHPFVCVC